MEQPIIPAVDPQVEAEQASFLARFWKEWGGMFIAFAIIILLMKVIFQVAWVPSGSMETTIPTRSVQICWRLPFFFGDPIPERGEVVTFWSEECNEVMVKRLIGLPGDTISFEGGYTYVNGEALDESYLPIQGITESADTFTVPEDCVFFMGDNRTGSFDSRFWDNSYIHRSELQAKVLVCFSFGREQSWQGIHIIK